MTDEKIMAAFPDLEQADIHEALRMQQMLFASASCPSAIP